VRLRIIFALLSLFICLTQFGTQAVNQTQTKPAPTTVEVSAQSTPTPTPTPLPPPTVKIDDYRNAAGRIIGGALTSKRAYERLAYLTDHIGNRLSGSTSLEQGIDWAVAEMRKDGLDNVRKQKVMVPHWVRGEESLEMISPVSRSLMMLGLGNSVGTPEGGVI
jgi:carboxypeptidase Q